MSQIKITTEYQATLGHKHTEIDSHDKGCIGTASAYPIDIEFKDPTLKGLIDSIKQFFNLSYEDLDFNSCDQLGRLDFQRHENKAGEDVTDKELRLWKDEGCTLWLCMYSFHIYKVESEAVDLGAIGEAVQS